MLAKILFIYLLVVASLGAVQAGTSAGQRQTRIRLFHRSADGIRGIAPLSLDQRQSNGGLGSTCTDPWACLGQ